MLQELFFPFRKTNFQEPKKKWVPKLLSLHVHFMKSQPQRQEKRISKKPSSFDWKIKYIFIKWARMLFYEKRNVIREDGFYARCIFAENFRQYFCFYFLAHLEKYARLETKTYMENMN